MSLIDDMKRMAGLAAISKRFQQLALEAQEYSKVIIQIAFAYDLKPSRARELFQEYCATSIFDWRQCQHEVFKGNSRWLDMIQNDKG